MNTVYLLASSDNPDDNPIIIGGAESGAAATNSGETTTSTEQAKNTTSNTALQDASGGLNLVGMVLMWGALFGALYFFMIRPQKKREKQMVEMQSSIRSGDNVMTSSGMYGKVTEVGEDCFVVEFGMNKGVRVPVRKSDVLGIKTPNINPSIKEISSTEK